MGGKGLSEQREETIGTTRSDYPDNRKVPPASKGNHNS